MGLLLALLVAAVLALLVRWRAARRAASCERRARRPAFLAASAFEGHRPQYVFGVRDGRLGYHPDRPPRPHDARRCGRPDKEGGARA